MLALLLAVAMPPPSAPAEVAAALRAHRLECNPSWQRGCFDLARRYEEGRGVKRSDAVARAFLQLACDGDDGRACQELAGRYLTGRGVARDPERAIALYAKACHAGVGHACGSAAALLEHESPRRDLRRAAELHDLACRRGVSLSCLHLAELLEEGRVLPADPARAAELRRRACSLGREEACP